MRTIRNKKLVGATMASAVILLGGLGGCGKSETSEMLVAQAKQFIQKGDTKAAIIQLKNALVKNPSDVDARMTLGALYSETGDPASAEKELRKAMSLGASPAKTAPAMASALLAQQQFQKVLDETAEESAKGDPALLAARGEAQLAMGHADQARESFNQALKAQPNHVSSLLGLARRALMQNDVEGAKYFVDQAVAGNPNDAAAWLFKGDMLRAENKTDEALAAYDRVLKAKPDHRSAHIEKAYVLIGTRKFDAAGLELAEARKAAPNSLAVTYTDALLDFNQGKYPAAKESLQKVLKLVPEHMPSILLSGAVEYALGSMPQAEQHLKKYVEKSPQNRYARTLLVTTLLKLGQTREALAVLAPMLADGKKDAQVLALAGEANMQAREFAKAADYFEKSTLLAPDAAVLHTSLAMSKLAQGDDARAITELERSTQLDAKSPKAATLLVLTELRRKNYDKALTAVKALEANQPNDASVYNLKGGVYLGKEDNANARLAFEKALALQPTFFPAAANLAQMAMKEKKPEVAKQQLIAFLDKDKKNVEAMNGLASLAAVQGHPDEVTQWLEKANAANPDAIAPAMLLGKHYLQIGQKEKALTLVRKFQVANPKELALLDLLGEIQLVSGDAAGALESFSKLVGLDSRSAQAHFRVATAHMELKNEAAAAEDLRKALAIKPDFLEAQAAQAELFVRKRQFEPALGIARQIQKQRPKDAVGFALEGNLMKMQGKPALALRAYEQAFAFGKTTQSLIKLHNAMLLAGKGKEAAARLTQWQKERPSDLPLKLYVAETMLTDKQYKPAIEKLEEVLKLSPDNVAGLNNLAWAYHQEKDPRALKTAERAYQLAATSPGVMDTLGWVLVEQGDPKRGVPLLQKASALAPGAPEIRYHLAVGLHKAGDNTTARKELERLIADGKEFAEMDQARSLLKQL